MLRWLNCFVDWQFRQQKDQFRDDLHLHRRLNERRFALIDFYLWVSSVVLKIELWYQLFNWKQKKLICVCSRYLWETWLHSKSWNWFDGYLWTVNISYSIHNTLCKKYIFYYKYQYIPFLILKFEETQQNKIRDCVNFKHRLNIITPQCSSKFTYAHRYLLNFENKVITWQFEKPLK